MATKYFCDRCGEQIPLEPKVWDHAIPMPTNDYRTLCYNCRDELVELIQRWFSNLPKREQV